jgi:hypothetical protein
MRLLVLHSNTVLPNEQDAAANARWRFGLQFGCHLVAHGRAIR